MAGLNAIRNFNANMAMSMQEATRLTMQDVQKNADRVDRRKEVIAQAGLERVQQNNRTQQALSESRQKIDVYA
ncbi:hypothetical protein [Chitinimonas lacunae]|uniref:Uncharacterized protein n=1 Tax=Chitinimonas lacunae TaxID=1963018 RepID=A0ABV8MLU6_9NEIS